MGLDDYASYTYAYASTVPPRLGGLLAAPSGGVVVDFGCGDGTLLMGLRDAGLLEGWTAVGVEGSGTRVDRLAGRWPGLLVLHSDVCRVDELPDGSVDLVVSTQVIEHVVDDRAMVAEMHRVLRPGGVLYLTTVFKEWYGWYFYRCGGRWVLDPTHLREYRHDDDLLPMISSEGFTVLTEDKAPTRFPLVDRALRALGVLDATAPWVRALRRVRVPVPGYREWEIVARKPPVGEAP